MKSKELRSIGLMEDLNLPSKTFDSIVTFRDFKTFPKGTSGFERKSKEFGLTEDLMPSKTFDSIVTFRDFENI
jgi:hypothetical protein